jgi:hypothetical protein
MATPSNVYEPSHALPTKLAQTMLQAVQKKYGRLIRTARKDWERRFAGADPSDACVTVRITGSNSREFARFFPLEFPQRPKRFVRN